MTAARAAIGALAVMASAVLPAGAADVSKPIETAALCAPRATTGGVPGGAPRIIGAQDTVGRTLFGARELVVIDSGGARVFAWVSSSSSGGRRDTPSAGADLVDWGLRAGCRLSP